MFDVESRIFGIESCKIQSRITKQGSQKSEDDRKGKIDKIFKSRILDFAFTVVKYFNAVCTVRTNSTAQ